MPECCSVAEEKARHSPSPPTALASVYQPLTDWNPLDALQHRDTHTNNEGVSLWATQPLQLKRLAISEVTTELAIPLERLRTRSSASVMQCTERQGHWYSNSQFFGFDSKSGFGEPGEHQIMVAQTLIMRLPQDAP